MTQTTDSILASTADLLRNPDRWTQGAMARTGKTKHDHEVNVANPFATCFCLLGARRRVLQRDNEPDNRTLKILATAVERLFPDRIKGADYVSFQAIAWFNDDPLTTHHDVLQVVATARVIQNEVPV